MRAAIYNPYLDTLGGGERYTLTFARVLANIGYRVDVEWKDKSIVQKIESRFGLKLDGINIIENINRGDSGFRTAVFQPLKRAITFFIFKYPSAM